MQEYIIGTALLGGAITTGLYTFLGRFTQFFIFLMGPLTGLLALWYTARYSSWSQEHRTVIAAVFVILLLGVVSAEFTYQIHTGDIGQDSDTDGASTGAWLAMHASSSTVQTDLMTSGRMRLAEEQHNGNFEWIWYDETSYAAVIEQGNPNAEYTVIDLESEAGIRATGGWTRFKSFGSYEERINANPYMNRIYDDGTHSVFW